MIFLDALIIPLALLAIFLLWKIVKNLFTGEKRAGAFQAEISDWLLFGSATFISIYFGSLVSRFLMPSYEGIEGGMIPIIFGTTAMQLCLLASMLLYRKFFSFKFSLFAGASLKDLWVAVKYYFAMMLVVFAATLFSAVVVEFITGNPPESQEIVQLLNKEESNYLLALSFCSFGILAPLVEEIYFRGLLYGMLKGLFANAERKFAECADGKIPRWCVSRICAAVLSAAFFASVHFCLSAFIPLFCIGLFLVGLYEKRGNLLAPILVHCVFNTVNAIIILSGLVDVGTF